MKKLLLLSTFLFVAVFVYSQNAAAAEKMVTMGVKLHDEGKYQDALNLYDKALELDADNQMALVEKALTLQYMDRNSEAIEICKKIITKYPNSPDLNTVYVTYGNALDASDKPSEALEKYDEGIKLFPDYYQLHFNKGITLAGEKDYDAALLCLQTAVKINPKHASSNNAIARLLYTKNKNVPALLAFGRFFVIEPEGKRAASNVELLDLIVYGNTEQTGKKSITISLNAASLGDTLADGRPTENSFSATEMIMALTSGLNFDKKNSKLDKAKKLENVFETVVASLSETKKDNYGFYWDFYVPYYISMKESGQLETFCYLVYASTEDKAVTKWIKDNGEKIREFYKWSGNYVW